MIRWWLPPPGAPEGWPWSLIWPHPEDAKPPPEALNGFRPVPLK